MTMFMKNYQLNWNVLLNKRFKGTYDVPGPMPYTGRSVTQTESWPATLGIVLGDGKGQQLACSGSLQTPPHMVL